MTALEGKTSKEARNAIAILLQENALGDLSDFLSRLKSARRAMGLGRDATVTSAARLSSADLAALKKDLQERFGMPVTLMEKTDGRVIGGFKLEAEEWQFDGTVRGKLERLATFIKH